MLHSRNLIVVYKFTLHVYYYTIILYLYLCSGGRACACSQGMGSGHCGGRSCGQTGNGGWRRLPPLLLMIVSVSSLSPASSLSAAA